MLRIDSYFSFPTDLASEMSSWPEFVEGREYSLKLKDVANGEEVSVQLVEATEDDHSHIRIRSNKNGILFDRVVGRVVYALSANSDNAMVGRTRE